MALSANLAMTTRPYTFYGRVSNTYKLPGHAIKYLITALAVSLHLLIPVYGFAQGRANDIRKQLEQLRSPIPLVRETAERALGRISPEAKEDVSILIAFLENKDEVRNTRRDAAGVLGEIKAKEAVSALIATLKDEDRDVRRAAAQALGKIGSEEAVQKLGEALKDGEPLVRETAVRALDIIGPKAKEAVSALIAALKDENRDVRRAAAQALVDFSERAFYANNTVLLPQLREAYKALKDHNDSEIKRDLDIKRQAAEEIRKLGHSDRELNQQVAAITQALKDHNLEQQAVRIKRALDYLELLWWNGLIEKILSRAFDNPYASIPVAAYLLLLICQLLIFWLRPLWFLHITTSLSRYEPKIMTRNIEFSLPLRHLLIVSLFHYRNRVLDRWVRQHLDRARENFKNRKPVKQRKAHVRIPTMLADQTCESISPADLQPIFNKPKVTVLITGEGGVGKTSLACQMATWATEDEPEDRLCKTHRMLPVLIEGNLAMREDKKEAFTEAIRGHLEDLIGLPEAVPEEMLLQLLRKRRVLVIIDALSELDDSTRRSISPVQPDFPVAALVATTRIDDDLGGATKTIIRPLRLKGDRLSSFMHSYLVQLGKRDKFTKEEFSEGCHRLSQIIGERDIIVLIATMYAKQMIAFKEPPSDPDFPHTLPDLMLSYVKSINKKVQADKRDTRSVLSAAKILAWGCLNKNCRPSAAKRDDVLKALKEQPDREAMLEYLEDRLHLIQTTGAAGEMVRFSLDPLAEYLAGLHLIESCGKRVSQWQKILDLIKAQLAAPETIKGFLLALLDCCEHHGQEHGVPLSVIEEIRLLLNSVPEPVLA
jgi:HEAT repeat protein